MKTFEACCKVFHAVEAAIVAHKNSDTGIQIREKFMSGELCMYWDLENWPECPDLRGLTAEKEKQLRQWGPGYSEQLEAFHRKAEELKTARYESIRKALRLLGEEMGEEFNLLTTGPLDVRIADVLTKADLLRKTLLDGVGYVDIRDPDAFFAKGFYGTTKLNRKDLYADLKLCAQHRSGALNNPEELARLGFDEGVCYENS